MKTNKNMHLYVYFSLSTCNDVILVCCSELLSSYDVGEEYLTGELADSFVRVYMV